MLSGTFSITFSFALLLLGLFFLTVCVSKSISQKRNAVENEADEVGTLISSMREKLSGIDKIIDDEGKRITSFKESRDKTSSF